LLEMPAFSGESHGMGAVRLRQVQSQAFGL
jgi:hypothetical protein